MLRSMTGFGRFEVAVGGGKLVIEIQSVNRKQLDIICHLPKEFSRFEPQIRQKIAEQISRGQVNLRVFFFPNAERFVGYLPAASVLKSVKSAWEALASEAGFSDVKIDLPFVMQYFPQIHTVELATDEDGSTLLFGLKEALHAMVKMKQKEGNAHKEDLEVRLEILERLQQQMMDLFPIMAQNMRERLTEKMKELLPTHQLDERIFQEMALLAEKTDATEEGVRLLSHIGQAKDLMKQTKQCFGRELEFFLQEIHREINTIGSKVTMDTTVTQYIIQMKLEVDRMKEQALNIE